MGKNKGAKSLRTIIVCTLLLIVLTVGVCIGVGKTVKYRVSGVKVEAVITVVGEEGDPDYIEAMYQGEDGRYRYGKVIFNGKPKIGETFEAYVLPDNPLSDIYRMPETWLTVTAIVLFAAIVIVLAVMIAKAAIVHKGNRLLSQHGIHVKGEVITITRKGDFEFDCNVNFRDNEGELHTMIVTFNRSIPQQNGEYPLLYYKDKKGRIYCDLIEL